MGHTPANNIILDKLNKTIEEFNLFELKKKADKVTKDIKGFTKERAYPYLKDDYYTSGSNTNRQNTWGRFKRNQPVTFSESSGGSSDSDNQPGPSRTDNHPGQPFLDRAGNPSGNHGTNIQERDRQGIGTINGGPSHISAAKQ